MCPFDCDLAELSEVIISGLSDIIWIAKGRVPLRLRRRASRAMNQSKAGGQ